MRPLRLLLGATAVAHAHYTRILPRLPRIDDLSPIPAFIKREQSVEACAKVADLWTQQNQNASAKARVPAELAYQCLQSVPVDVDGDVQEIEELKEFLEYQTTLAWLKAGVDGQIKPLDLMGSLDSIAWKVKAGRYENDYDVQFDIRALFDSSGDYHLTYFPDITSIFSFTRPNLLLLSLSEDSLELPKIFVASDLISGTTPSPVVTINGQNASDYVEQFTGNSYHDIDARYNAVFPNPALDAIGQDEGGLFASHYVYQGPNTNLTFANGTTKTIDNIATIRSGANFTNVKDGSSFFEKFCHNNNPSTDDTNSEDAEEVTRRTVEEVALVLAATTTASSIATSTPTSKPVKTLTNYPYPAFVNEDASFSGYYLNESDYKDVAVLAVPSFNAVAEDPDRIPMEAGLLQTKAMLRKFFADAVQQGKKKLVIDLRGNSGGTIDLSFEFFKELFPSIVPYGASRYRASEAFHYFSAVVADLAVNGSNVDGYDNPDDFGDGDYALSSFYLWSNIENENGTQYKSFDEYWGPYEIHNDTFSGLRRYNFSNDNGGHTLTASLTGYDGQAAPSQPFPAENIILLQDGLCGSACAIFSELMREQGKVQTVVMGGRPQNGPMQGVGGTKGTQVLPFDVIYNYAAVTLGVAKALNGAQVAQMLNETTAVGRIINSTQLAERSSPCKGKKINGSVNSLNNERANDTLHIPLEFIYEAADCRLFYTKNTYADVVALWKQTVDTTWGNGKCVSGSTGDKSAVGVVTNKPFGLGQKKSLAQNHNSATGLSVSRFCVLIVATATIILTI